MNLFKHLRRHRFREVDACHLCTKGWRKLFDLDEVELSLGGMRHVQIIDVGIEDVSWQIQCEKSSAR